MADSTRSSIVIEAPAGDVIDVIADVETYPEWAQGMQAAEVLTEEGDGWPDQVRFSLDAGAIKDTYVLDYEWDISEDGSGSVSWHLVEGGVLKTMDGTYTLVSQPDGSTAVTYELEVSLKIALLGMLRRKAERVIVDTALKDLKAHVEGAQA
ncbi:SRPBCC family protein [Kribbia dieselivorans]|uniref:SRPBCC family protein n=1 Tax=Kribbia dieselivorans TaxID=331526 RepID=UPI00083892C5|nr:SRPBCC family protein [Kribbia dieselivorans]